MEKETLFYNTVALACEGDYRRIAGLKKDAEHWKNAYEKMALGSRIDPEREWEKLQNAGIKLILFEDSAFPAILKEIHNPPFGIYIRCHKDFDLYETQNNLAIVGTRRGTPEGKTAAKKFARELTRADFCIVSGLALGIDAAAHAGCLEAQGRTIAILANGLDSVYPHTNESLAQKIIQSGGALISEYPPGAPPFPSRFLERNRIVSGLSKGVLVIESPEKSGSLATARFALEQNRDVFVIPGPISHPNFFGSHALIRQGAELVTKSEDILESYGIARKEILLKEEEGASAEEKLILEALRSIAEPIEIDKISAMTKLEPRIANQAITFLILKNLIKETESGYTI